MVRIKVVKASQIALAGVVTLAVIAAIIVGIVTFTSNKASPQLPSVQQKNTEAPLETLPPINLDGAAIPNGDPIILLKSASATMAERASRSIRSETFVSSPYDSNSESNLSEDKLYAVPTASNDDDIELILIDSNHQESESPEYDNFDIETSDNEVFEIEIISTASISQSEILKSPENPEQTENVNTTETQNSLGKAEILIYHTHSREAYEQNPDKPQYVEAGNWRTADPRFSVIRLGEELKTELESRGISTIHDVTDHEPPKHGTSYSRSLVTLENYYKKEPSLKIFIDLHRDGYVEGQKGSNTVEVDGINAAKLMFLIGNGEGSTDSGGFFEKPDWEENYKLAEALTNAINNRAPGLCRTPMVRTGRYNQHVSTSCLLVEIGNNKNTLDEALATIPYLAQAIEAVIGTMNN